MAKELIIAQALENLEKGTGITGRWVERNDVDGEIHLNIDGRELQYVVVVKPELRAYQIEQLLTLRDSFANILLITGHLFPKVKAELQKLAFPYLEGNGNVFIKEKQRWLWIDTNRNPPIRKATGNRAFTKTGLKVLFYLLLDPHHVNQPQRWIAEQAGVALGNIPLVMDGLKEAGYLLEAGRKNYLWKDRRTLIDRWVTEYDTKLKPYLHLGNFQAPEDWPLLRLENPEEVWGGEPAGDRLTNYLRPETLKLYTRKTRADFIKFYRLKPDKAGDLELSEMFWKFPFSNEAQTAPPLLVYADLKLTNNQRCRETASKIWNEYIEPHL